MTDDELEALGWVKLTVGHRPCWIHRDRVKMVMNYGDGKRSVVDGQICDQQVPDVFSRLYGSSATTCDHTCTEIVADE